MRLNMQRGVMMIKIEDNDINKIENILLPQGCHFLMMGKI